MSEHIQKILQGAYILATGHSANARGLVWAEDLVSQSSDFGTLATVVNDYMDILARQQGVVTVVQAIAKNGYGITLSDAETTLLISDLMAQGVDSWSKLFERALTLENVAGNTLDNRVQAATDFLSSLDAAGKSADFTGPGVDNAVRTLLQNITGTATSLANGTIGFDALVSNLNEAGISGTVFGVGYITGATVFADTNRDGILNVGEWSTTTDSNGKFVLPNSNDDAKIIAFGGTDLMTGNAFRGVFSSFAGTTSLNTFTTLIEAMVVDGQVGTVADATAALQRALGLPETINLLSYDPLAVLASSAADADKTLVLSVQASAQQITNVLTQTAHVIVGSTADSTNVLNAFAAVVAALSNAIATSAGTASTLDLTSITVLESVIQAAVTASNSTLTVQQVGQIAQVTAASNSSAAGAINITELSQAVTVSLGDATTALILGVANGDFNSALSGFTGANLTAANHAATVGFIDAVVPVPPPPSTPSVPVVASDSIAPIAPTGLTLAIADDSGISNTDNLTKNTVLIISGAAEAGSTVRIYDTDGTTVLGTGTATGGTFSIAVTLTEGVHSITAKATDANLNTGAPSNVMSVTVDITAPSATIVISDVALKAGETAGVTITFNEAVSGFSNADLSIEGGTLTDVATADLGITWTATFTPTVNLTDTSNVITLTNTGVSDAAGNAGVGTTNSNVYAIDTSAPTLSVSLPLDDATAVLVNANIVLTFSEDVVVGSGNIVISDGSDIRTIAAGDAAQVTISGNTVTVNPTAHLNPNTLYFVQMAAGVLADTAGNPFAGIADTTTLNFVTGTDTITINPVPGNLILIDSFWTGTVGIDKIVITTTDTGTQTITTAGIFESAFAEGVDLKTTSSTGTIDINMSSYTGAATLTTVSSTGNQTILTGSNADIVTISTQAATGNSITTGDGNDKITIFNTGGANGSAYVITGGLGADTINLDLAQVSQDTIVIGDNDSGITLATADFITGFISASDSLNFGTAGTAGNFVVASVAVADFAAALAAANIALASLAVGAEKYSFQWDATNGYLFNDTDGDSIADQVVVLVGINGAEIAMENIVA